MATWRLRMKTTAMRDWRAWIIREQCDQRISCFAYSSSCCGSYTWITRIMASNVMKKAVQNSSLRTKIGLNPVYNAMGPSTRAMLVNASTMPVYTSRPPA